MAGVLVTMLDFADLSADQCVEVYFNAERAWYAGIIWSRHNKGEGWQVHYCDGTKDKITPESSVRLPADASLLGKVALLDKKIEVQDITVGKKVLPRTGQVVAVDEVTITGRNSRALWCKVQWVQQVGIEFSDRARRHVSSKISGLEFNVDLTQLGGYRIAGGARNSRTSQSPSVPGLGDTPARPTPHAAKPTPSSAERREEKQRKAAQVAGGLQDSLSVELKTGTRSGQKKDSLPQELQVTLNKGHEQVGRCIEVEYNDYLYKGVVSNYDVDRDKYQVHTHDGDKEWYRLDGQEPDWSASQLKGKVRDPVSHLAVPRLWTNVRRPPQAIAIKLNSEAGWKVICRHVPWGDAPCDPGLTLRTLR